MKREEIKNKVISICADKLGFDEENINENLHLRNDLGMDSLDDIELIMEFEKEFKISISDEEAEKITTIKEIIDGLDKKINNDSPTNKK